MCRPHLAPDSDLKSTVRHQAHLKPASNLLLIVLARRNDYPGQPMVFLGSNIWHMVRNIPLFVQLLYGLGAHRLLPIQIPYTTARAQV